MNNRSKRHLGLDYGLKRIGLALSDFQNQMALPISNCEAFKSLEQTVASVLQEVKKIEQKFDCQIVKIIIGMPYMLNGQIGEQGLKVQKFYEALAEKVFDIELVLWDERLTTSQADKSLATLSYSRKQVVDSVSAAIILDSFLNLPK